VYRINAKPGKKDIAPEDNLYFAVILSRVPNLFYSLSAYVLMINYNSEEIVECLIISKGISYN